MKTKRPLRPLLTAAAFAVLALSLGTWVVTGRNTGWTKTEVTEQKHDEITGIDYPEVHKAFVAGVDILIAGSALAAVLGAGAFVAGRRPARVA